MTVGKLFALAAVAGALVSVGCDAGNEDEASEAGTTYSVGDAPFVPVCPALPSAIPVDVGDAELLEAEDEPDLLRRTYRGGRLFRELPKLLREDGWRLFETTEADAGLLAGLVAFREGHLIEMSRDVNGDDGGEATTVEYTLLPIEELPGASIVADPSLPMATAHIASGGDPEFLAEIGVPRTRSLSMFYTVPSTQTDSLQDRFVETLSADWIQSAFFPPPRVFFSHGDFAAGRFLEMSFGDATAVLEDDQEHVDGHDHSVLYNLEATCSTPCTSPECPISQQ